MVEPDQAAVIEFKWGKKKCMGGKKKDVQFYESFTWDGGDYSLYDTVYVFDETAVEPDIGILIKIWELPDGSKKVKTLWFFRPCEISKFIGDAKFAKNELLLASGEGVGLTNINPLEAIAGKCKVVRTSNNELQGADFTFYRTFDVGHRTISEHIDEKIAGTDIKFLFSRMHTQESSTIQKLDLKEKCFEEKSLVIGETNKINVCGTDVVTHKTNASSQSTHLREKMPKIQCDDGEKLVVITRPNETNGRGGFETTTSSIKDNIAIKQPRHSLVVDKPSLQQEPTSSSDVDRAQHRELASIAIDWIGLKTKDKTSLRPKENCLGASDEKVGKVLVDQGRVRGKAPEVGNINERPNNEARVNGLTKVYNKRNVQGGQNESSGQATLRSSKFSRDAEKNLDGKKKTQETTCVSNGKVIKDDKINERLQKATRDSSCGDAKVIAQGTKHERDSQGFDGAPSKKPKLDEKSSTSVGCKTSKPSLEQASKKGLNPGNKPQRTEPAKKPKIDEKLSTLAGYKTSKPSLDQASNKGLNPINNPQRLEVDKSKWFKLPWDERLQMAHEQGKVVLLQNLDPSFSSTEVEEIIQKAFKLSCSAKMIQRTAFSIPNYGQAFAIFNARQAAEMVVAKLDKGCLMLPNGRPLIGTFAAPCFPTTPSTFCGHLGIDKPKHQMHREMKDAVFTSHCSQPNTIEYDMAAEWRLLAERSDNEWKSLNKLHGNELRNLKAALKSK